MIFLTGDLGFGALEPLRESLGDRFMNAGVAEQNMISVSAGICQEGFDVWLYSIAPFCYARPFEQIRNDICFHNLPIKLIGNGGGYAYGVMGPTHHAIEDYGVLLTLPGMGVFVPTFNEDVAAVILRMGERAKPSYLRLGRGELPKGHEAPPYAPWRQLTEGDGPVVIAVGPLAGLYLAVIESLAVDVRPNLWSVCQLPLSENPMPQVLLDQLEHKRGLCVAEEHVVQGSFGSALAMFLIENGIVVGKFKHMYAQSHIYNTYGSQTYLRGLSLLDAGSLLRNIHSLLETTSEHSD
jgi:transketolase